MEGPQESFQESQKDFYARRNAENTLRGIMDNDDSREKKMEELGWEIVRLRDEKWKEIDTAPLPLGIDDEYSQEASDYGKKLRDAVWSDQNTELGILYAKLEEMRNEVKEESKRFEESRNQEKKEKMIMDRVKYLEEYMTTYRDAVGLGRNEGDENTELVEKEIIGLKETLKKLNW